MKIPTITLATTLAITSTLLAVNEFQEFEVDPNLKLPTAPLKAQDAWRAEKFGMFIHWGPISQMGAALSHSRLSESHRTGGKPYKPKGMDPKIYDAQYKTFNPTKFDPDGMIKMAKDAGISYVVLTSKHHAGFSMFDSKVSEYDMMSTPYKKDITKMLAEASKKQDVNFGFYYSPRDWHHPDCDSDKHQDRYIKYYKAQMKELLSNYGPIHEIWFDGMGPGRWGDTSREVMTMIRKLQPNAMVNDRGGAGADFYTPEHYTSYFNRKDFWEACHTTTSQWGYNPKVSVKPLKQLMEILLYTWGADGNMLLNIGPMGDGTVNPVEKERFEQLAKWWKKQGESSIRDSRGGPYIPGPWGVATCKEKNVYLHVFNWPKSGTLDFPALQVKGKPLKFVSAKNLTKKEISVNQAKDGSFSLDVPQSDRDKIVTTLELTFDGEILPVKPLQRVPSLTNSAKINASHNVKDLNNLCDQDANTDWAVKLNKGDKSPIWVTAQFDKPTTISGFSVARGHNWSPKHKAEVQITDENGKWQTITNKRMKLKWEPIKFFDKPVTTRGVRLVITNTNKFNIAEFELYGPITSGGQTSAQIKNRN